MLIAQYAASQNRDTQLLLITFKIMFHWQIPKETL